MPNQHTAKLPNRSVRKVRAVRFSDDEWQRVRAAAKARKLTEGEYVRLRALEG